LGDVDVFVSKKNKFLNINIKTRNIIGFLLAIALCSTYSIAGTLVPYICIFAAVFISVVRHGIPGNIRSYEIIPIAIVFCWMYGLIVGLAKNPINGVIANFAGMSCYLVFYALKSSKIEKFEILRVIKFSAIINIIYAFVSIVDSLLLGNFITNGVIDAGNLNVTIGQFRLYWSLGVILIIGYFGSFFAKFITKSQLFASDFFGASLAVASILSTFSKGFILQLFFTMFFIAFGIGLKGIKKSMVSRYLILFLIFAVVSISVHDSVYVTAFGITLESELVEGSRDEQRAFLIDEFSFFGSGLGATLKSGYSRDALGYSFELNYENLIHKLGVFSLIVFASYLLTFLLIFKKYFKTGDPQVFGTSLGLFFFLIPGYGNPILFAPTTVVLHCIVIYLNMIGVDKYKSKFIS
jgi:hypothetical protein